MVSFKFFSKAIFIKNINSKHERRNTKVYSGALQEVYLVLTVKYTCQLELLHFINGHCQTQQMAFSLSFYKVLASVINVSFKESCDLHWYLNNHIKQ